MHSHLLVNVETIFTYSPFSKFCSFGNFDLGINTNWEFRTHVQYFGSEKEKIVKYFIQVGTEAPIRQFHH